MKPLLVFFSIAVTLVGCDQVSQLADPSPGDVYKTFATATIEGDFETAYNTLSAQDRAFKPLAEYKTSQSEGYPFFKMLVGDMQMEVVETKIDGDSATIKVKQTVPDMQILMREMLGAAFGKKEESGIEERLKEKYADGGLPTTVISAEHILVRDPDGWKVFKDFRRTAERKAREEKIAVLLKEAKELRKQQNYEAAVTAYSAVLEEQSDNDDAKTALNEIEFEVAAKRKSRLTSARSSYMTSKRSGSTHTRRKVFRQYVLL